MQSSRFERRQEVRLTRLPKTPRALGSSRSRTMEQVRGGSPIVGPDAARHPKMTSFVLIGSAAALGSSIFPR